MKTLLTSIVSHLASAFAAMPRYLHRAPRGTALPYLVVVPLPTHGQEYTSANEYTEWMPMRLSLFSLAPITAYDTLDAMAKSLQGLSSTGLMAVRRGAVNIEEDPDPDANGAPVYQGLLEIDFQVQRSRT